MASTETLAALLKEPLTELPARWKVPAQEKLLAQARKTQAEGGADAYWEWVAEQLRWTKTWSRVREGHFPEFTYFPGATMNVCDNCVDRWAENPKTADKPAIVWEGEPGDTRTVTYRELRTETAKFANALLSLGVTAG